MARVTVYGRPLSRNIAAERQSRLPLGTMRRPTRHSRNAMAPVEITFWLMSLFNFNESPHGTQCYKSYQCYIASTPWQLHSTLGEPLQCLERVNVTDHILRKVTWIARGVGHGELDNDHATRHLYTVRIFPAEWDLQLLPADAIHTAIENAITTHRRPYTMYMRYIFDFNGVMNMKAISRLKAKEKHTSSASPINSCSVKSAEWKRFKKLETTA